jgi:hypothetical protein
LIICNGQRLRRPAFPGGKGREKSNFFFGTLVREPSLYSCCSAGWFQRRATTSFHTMIMKFGTERVKVPDDFEVEWSGDDE